MVTILFARQDSVYKSLPNCDVYDIDRDALTWKGGSPVVAHPPCRLWGRLRKMAKVEDPEAERHLALWSIDQVRQWGGVLEHPAHSTLWHEAQLPLPSQSDEFGGYTIQISQWMFGHRADKPTWLYICGRKLDDLPPIPQREGIPSYVINSTKNDSRPEVTKAERERTPLALAKWLVEVARGSLLGSPTPL